jgi:hypothetical protein
MSFLHPKINPFSSFTISLGPLYVERVFDSLLTLQGVNEVVTMAAIDRFARYLDYLKKRTNNYKWEEFTLIQFYKGHFYQQLANHTPLQEHARHHQEKALCYFQSYLELSHRSDESRFYAQWQIGLMQDLLDYPWKLSENSLLQAHTIDSFRGEPFKALVAHFVRAKDWETAYSYSSFALINYFDKNPAIHRRWFIHFDSYNWTLIHTHLTICYKLGYLNEAEAAWRRILDYERRHPDEFKDSEIRRIHSLERIFHPKRALASAS